MAKSNAPKIELTAYDDLFQTDESRAEARLSKIRDIPISEIDEFPDHPFKVLMDEDMEQLVESIKRNGVMTPATVRLKEDGRYELISGHRRKKACELAGVETLKCEVKELSRDEAIIIMVESNLQRSTILSRILQGAYCTETTDRTFTIRKDEAMKKYVMQICIAAAVCLLGAAAFCGYHIYEHYAHEAEQTEAFEQIADKVEQAQMDEDTPQVPLNEEETILPEYGELFLQNTDIVVSFIHKLPPAL